MKITTFKLIGASLFAIFLTACAQKPVLQDYSAWREESPKSILVLPPVNESPDVKATNTVLSVMTQPLAEAGFYVYPVGPMMETFRQNGLSMAGDIATVPYQKLREVFGADAALYVNVTQYGSSYEIINAHSEVALQARLVSLKSGRTLWQGRSVVADNSSDHTNSIIMMLILALVSHATSSSRDVSHEMASQASWLLLQANVQNGILLGPRAPNYGKPLAK